MYKRVRGKNTNCEYELSYPANRYTSFYIEGRDSYYTIIDVLSEDNHIFALLENNELGEDDSIIVVLNPRNVYTIERYDHKPINTGLSEKASKAIFILESQIVTDRIYDDIKTVLTEECLINEEAFNVIEWDDKDIDKETLFQGGLVK